MDLRIELCPCCVDVGVNSNFALAGYLCYRFRDSSFYFVAKNSKNLGVRCQGIERDVAPIRPKCPHKTVAKSMEFLNCLKCTFLKMKGAQYYFLCLGSNEIARKKL